MREQQTLPPATDRRRRRLIGLTLYAIGFAGWWYAVGLPSDMITAVGWLWLAAICWRIDRPVRQHLGFLRDWAPLVVLLSLYDLSRAFADTGARPHVTELIQADRWMFGGELPTVWLQRRFFDPTAVHWWDTLGSWIYFSHFVVLPGIALVLWLRNRAEWARFVRRWVALAAAGLTTYFLYPAAPPWWAARDGLIEEVTRGSYRGWQAIGLHKAGNMLAHAQDLANPIAAMPSLHSGFAMLAVGFFALRARRRWWPLLAAYPVSMGLVLVYTAEHWVIDVFFGWAYVGVVLAAVAAAERVWARWRADRGPADRDRGRSGDQPANSGRARDDPARLVSTSA